MCRLSSRHSSHDDQMPLDTMAALGASAALSISDVPFMGPVANVRIALDENDEFIVNPTAAQVEASRLDLRVTGSQDALLMVECASEEVDEEMMVQALDLAHRSIQPLIELQKQMQQELGKTKQGFPSFETPAEIDSAVREWLGDRMNQIIQETSMKEDRNDRLDALQAELDAAFTDAETGAWRYEKSHVRNVYESVKKETVRRRILDQGERPDGRGPSEIRAAVGGGGAAAARPRLRPLHARRDAGAHHRHPRHAARGAGRWTTWRQETRSATCTTTTSRPTQHGRNLPAARPVAAARSATAPWPSAPCAPMIPPIGRVSLHPAPRVGGARRPTAPPRWPRCAAPRWRCWTPACRSRRRWRASPWAWSPMGERYRDPDRHPGPGRPPGRHGLQGGGHAPWASPPCRWTSRSRASPMDLMRRALEQARRSPPARSWMR